VRVKVAKTTVRIRLITWEMTALLEEITPHLKRFKIEGAKQQLLKRQKKDLFTCG
jgi:hypothetical protein